MRHLVAVFAGIGVMFAAMAGLALAIVVGLAATGAMLVARLTGKLRPAMARSHANRKTGGANPDYRVWNDGRGTIIDM